jgi:anaerobic selenocysteine-containing dehydrogenase
MASLKTVVQTTCPLDCPDACSLEVEVEGERVVKVGGSERNPYTQGFVCSKVRRAPELLSHPTRLLYPEVRTGPKGSQQFRRVSWDEALNILAERLRSARDTFGGESILPFSYGGSNGLLSQDTTDLRLFRRLGASRLLRTVCSAATTRAAFGLYGKMPGVGFPDYAEAELIVLWGVNPSVSGIHFVPVLQEAQRRGAKLVVIDPRRTNLAKKADIHLQPRPGSDLALALSMVRWFFEEDHADWKFLSRHARQVDELRRRAHPWTFDRAAEASGIPAADIEWFAELYRATSPAVIRAGWGFERNRNGGSAVAAVLALPAVAGKFGCRGGGYTLSNSGAWRFPDDAINEPVHPTREVNMNRLGAVLGDATPPIKVLFVYNCNPLATMPDQGAVRRGLERDDLFTVVFDLVRTDTAQYADLLLPATHFFEHHDLVRSYGVYALQRVEPVVPAVGEARPNGEVFADVIRRLGLHQAGEAERSEEFEAALLATNPRVRGDLDANGIAEPDCGASPIPFVDVFPLTSDQKVHLVPETLDFEAPGGLYCFRPDPRTERFPLALISPATSRTTSSSMGQFHRQHVALEMHPGDAAPRGIVDGGRVRLFNDLGEVETLVHLSVDIALGTVALAKGLWSHNTLSGTTANALAPADLADLGGGACFNDARVEVSRADRAVA